jgi:tetratricopeptide (TPR) repeat protein
LNLVKRIASYWKLQGAGTAESRGDFAVAFELYREIVDDFGTSERAMAIWNKMGMLAYARKDFAAATSCYERALAIDPKEPGLYMNLANALHEVGDLAGAKVAYEKALAVTRRPDLLYNYAVFLENEDPRRAIALLEEVLRAPEESLAGVRMDAEMALQFLARIGERQSLVPEVALFFVELAERPRGDLRTWAVLNHHAIMLSRAGRHDKAFALFDRIVTQWPEETDARYNLGMALLRAGRPRDAQAEFQRVDHPVAHYGMARTHELENRVSEAVDAYRKFVDGMEREPLTSLRLRGWDPGAEEIRHASDFIARHGQSAAAQP